MVPYILLCLCLWRDMQLVTGGNGTPINVVQSPGTNTTLTNNFSSTTTDTAEITTIIIDIQSPDINTILINNFSSATADIASTEITTVNNDVRSPGTDTTLTKYFGFTTKDTSSEETATGIDTSLTKNFSLDTASEEIATFNYDVESSATSESALTDIRYTTTDSVTPKCEATFQNYQEIISVRNQLDELFEQTMISCHAFIQTKNQTIGEYTINLTRNYLEFSRTFIEGFQLQSTIIKCQNSTISQKCEFDVSEYKEKVEIVEILSDELGKMMGKETEYVQLQDDDGEQNETEEILIIFEELNDVFKLNKKVKELETVEQEQCKTYNISKMISNLGDDIRLKEVVKIQREMLQIIKSSKNMRYLYDQYSSKANVVRNLVNVSNLEGKLKTYERLLIEQREQREIAEQTYLLNEVMRPIVLGTIFIVGFTGNVILLLVFVRHKDMRTAPNVMVINLNIADIFNLIFNILLHTLNSMSPRWTLGTALCKLYRFCRYLCFGLSIYSIVVISVQRFLALTDYFTFKDFRCGFYGKFQSTLNVLFVWVIAMAFSIPRATKAQVENLECKSWTKQDEEFFKKFIYADFAIYCALPLSIIALTSGLSSLRLKSSIRNMPGEAMGQERVLQARVLSSKVFLALIVVFAMCFTPYYLIIICLRNECFNQPSAMTKKYLAFVLYCLMNSNASFNPIALYLVSSKYRKYMRPYFYFKYSNKRSNSETSIRSNDTVETRM